MAQSAQDLGYPHPLIGQTVRVKPGAKPSGWDPDENFDDAPASHYTTVKDVAVAEEGYPFGTVEVGGWWYDLADVAFN